MYQRKSETELSNMDLQELQVHMDGVKSAARASRNSDHDVAYMLRVRNAIANRKLRDSAEREQETAAQNDQFLKKLDRLSRDVRNRHAEDPDAKALRDLLKDHFKFEPIV